MNEETLRLFILDLGNEIKVRALEAKQDRDRSEPGSQDWALDSGRVLGFNEVISIIQQTAEGFGIPLTALKLEDIEPDRDLV